MKHLYLYLCLVLSICFISCNDDMDEPTKQNIVGSWYGTRTYYNPVSGTKYQYITVRFESNGTGSLDYEGPTSYQTALFKYQISGNTIKCTGAYANSSGDVEENFEMSLRIEEDRLIPTDRFTQFILTKDNSVMTDGDGNEIIDKTEYLEQVWVNTYGDTVVEFRNGWYVEYLLTEPFAKTYTYKNEGSYYYDPARNIININGTQFDIYGLNSSFLAIKRQSDGKILSYNVGSASDIPVKKNDKVEDYNYGDKYNGPKTIKIENNGGSTISNITLDRYSRIKSYNVNSPGNSATVYYDYKESEVERYWMSDEGNKYSVTYQISNGKITGINAGYFTYDVTYDSQNYGSIKSIVCNDGSVVFKNNYYAGFWVTENSLYQNLIERTDRDINWSYIQDGEYAYAYAPIWAWGTLVDIFLYEQGLFGPKIFNNEITYMYTHDDPTKLEVYRYITTNINSNNQITKFVVGNTDGTNSAGEGRSYTTEYIW